MFPNLMLFPFVTPALQALSFRDSARLKLGLWDPVAAQQRQLRKLFKKFGPKGPRTYREFTRTHEVRPLNNSEIPSLVGLRRAAARDYLFELLSAGPRLRYGAVRVIAPGGVAPDTETSFVGKDVGGRAIAALLSPFIKLARARDGNWQERLDVLALQLLADERLEVIVSGSDRLCELVFARVPRLLNEIRSGSAAASIFRTYDLAEPSGRRLKKLRNSSLHVGELWPGLKLYIGGSFGRAPQLPDFFADDSELLRVPLPFYADSLPLAVPYLREQYLVPLSTELFFELEDEEGEISQLADVRTGSEYKVIVSHPEGLLRARLPFIVGITTVARSTPCFSYLGHDNRWVSLGPTRISARTIERAVERLPHHFGLPACVVVARSEEGRSRLEVVLQQQSMKSLAADEISEALDRELQKILSYRLARESGGAEAPAIRLHADLQSRYMELSMRESYDERTGLVITNDRIAAQLSTESKSLSSDGSCTSAECATPAPQSTD